MYAVQIGSSGAAALAFRVSELADELLAVEEKARDLLRYGRRLPHLWP